MSDERGIVGCALTWPRSPELELLFASGLSPTMFRDPAMGKLWAVAVAAHDRGERLPIETEVIARIAEVEPGDVDQAVTEALTGRAAVWAARGIAERLDRIRFGEELGEITKTLTEGGSTGEARAALEGLLARPDSSAAYPSFTITDAIDAERPYDWVIPKMLERGDRLLITATEGAGKTELLQQIAIMAAAGVHPWTCKATRPVNALIVDLELGTPAVARRIARLARQAGVADEGRLRWVSKPDGIDVLRGGAAFLAAQLAQHPAELVCLGPLYKAHGPAAKGDAGGENTAKEVSAVFDRLIARFGFALVMETHAPHASGGVRNLRPFGSTVWLRWPDFGVGLYPDDDEPDSYVVDHWRGPRDARLWPDWLDRNQVPWSWTARWRRGVLNTEEAMF